jgi:NAD(P)-dependent dehydrogenase (short-subunit alcohol dehydrogenase family)
MLRRVLFFAPRSAYSAAKHALNALTANLRMELRTEKIAAAIGADGVALREVRTRLRQSVRRENSRLAHQDERRPVKR